MNKPKILVLDIETKPAQAFVWRMWKVDINPEMLISPGGTICVGAKWVGDSAKHFMAEWQEGGHKGMLKQVHELLSEADAVVTYNGDKFDLPKLNGEFILNGFKPIPPLTSIDLIKTVRKFGFDMNRLGFIGPLLGLGDKIKHEGFSLWTKVMGGDEKAQGRMKKYCLQDVVLTEALYKKVRPFIRNHPHLGDTKSLACGSCGSKHTHSRGYRRTKTFRIQRIQCQDCGSWSDGIRSKV
jgi:RNase_H superfamily